MNHVKFFADISKKDVDIAGGKGASLGELTQARIQVPNGFVFLASAFDRFIEEGEIKEEIAARLNEVKQEDMNSVDRASNVIRGVINDTKMPDDLTAEILQAFKQLGAEFVAVRSSATAEDSSVASWAGELESYLNTTGKNVVENVKQCWSSLFTPRAIFYRHEKNLIKQHVSVAVVVQKMVQSEISGITFTVHPVTEDREQMIIEACYGLGEAIVGGLVTPDSYIVNKKDMSIIDVSVGEQGKKMIKTNIVGGANEWVELSKEDGGKQKLTAAQILQVAGQCKKVEEHYGFPCDIEWAMEGGDLYIVQSRPITTLQG